MTEEQRDILIAKMIDFPTTLIDSEIDAITHDDELSGIYEMSAVLCGAYANYPEIDIPKEWALFRPNITKKPLISRRVLQAAAILIVAILTSYTIINIVGVEKGRDQNPEIANIAPMQERNTDSADSRIASIPPKSNAAEYSNMGDTEAPIAPESPSLKHNEQSILTSTKQLSELTPPQQSLLVCGLGYIPKNRRQISQTEYDNSLDRTRYWLDMGKDLSDDEYMNAYVATLDSLDITIIQPEDFMMYHEKDSPFIFYPNKSFKSRYFQGIVGWSILGPIFESELKDALIAYPLMVEEFGMSPDSQIEAELIAANGDEDIDITNMLTIIEGPEVANADKIVTYEFKIADSLFGDYTHCVALAFRKKNHYALPVKIFLNEDGLRHKDKYIRAILNSVRYGDMPNKIMQESEKRVAEMEIPEATYPRILPEYNRMEDQK